jgi:FkbM family methyltransferase
MQREIEPTMRASDCAPALPQWAIIEFCRQFGCGNGALRKYGALWLEILRKGPIDYDYFGLKLRFFPPILGSRRHMLLTPNWSDHRERSFIDANLPPSGVFFDVGAHTGFYTFYVAARRPSCTIVSVEPVHAYAETLRFNVQANRLTHVLIEETALSDCEGVADFNSETESMIFGSQSIRVPTTTLEQLAGSLAITKIDCLKIDVEGMEDRVIAPFFHSAPKSLWPKAMVIEHACSRFWGEDCIVLLKSKGYREVWRNRLNTALLLE